MYIRKQIPAMYDFGAKISFGHVPDIWRVVLKVASFESNMTSATASSDCC